VTAYRENQDMNIVCMDDPTHTDEKSHLHERGGKMSLGVLTKRCQCFRSIYEKVHMPPTQEKK
jgi:hypothetical protein